MKPRHVHYVTQQRLPLEVHQITDYVAVIFPLRKQVRHIDSDLDGRPSIVITFERCDQPRIAFARVDVGKGGAEVLTERTPADNAMDPQQAMELAGGLADACSYLSRIINPDPDPSPPAPQSEPASAAGTAT